MESVYVTAPSADLSQVPGFRLPPAPTSETGPVKIWSEPVTLRTYHPAPPDKNPLFLERRVYQGSSGRVYPLPFIDRIATEAVERTWQAIHIENQYVRVMILPELGGRIHVGLDKTNGYHFFYRQNVIKPALVGLAGPWISGGVEFNWPQHHRPATFMPVDWEIERAADGSCTVWCSDHDPMNRLKGMHGVCLRPDRSYIELKVRLYNRTLLTQTFLWWANVGVHVHEEYQSFFPPDVHWVADHANRAVSAFPLCEGRYYGVDYGARTHKGIPANEIPRKFVPPGAYPPNDLSWYANIPVPTSYMAVGSRGDFSGGYDHRAQAGVVHVADHHISPGKKQWTWGNHEFGYAWDRHLTDSDGPYIELMAGVYTDNQPDFSFLAPGETKTFSQFWYPIQKIGPVQQANTDAALSLRLANGLAAVGVCTTKRLEDARVEIQQSGKLLRSWVADIAPESPFFRELSVVSDAVGLTVRDSSGVEIARYEPAGQAEYFVPPKPATVPPSPAEVQSADELFVIGTHLDQYRHATRFPQSYWQEAVRRDAGDSRASHSLGLHHLRRGEFEEAERCFRRAMTRLTDRNANPREGEVFYSLGLALRYRSRTDEAYNAFYKATWNYAWRSAAYYALAEVDASRGNWAAALQHIRLCLRTNADHTSARNLGVMLWRKLGKKQEAENWLGETLELDPLDYWARFLASRTLGDNQALLDVAFDLVRAGFFAEANELLDSAQRKAVDGSVPMVHYTLGYIAELRGDPAASAYYRAGAEASPDYCFPSRLEEWIVLQAALRNNPEDHRAFFYIGNWLYDRGRQEEAIDYWQRSTVLCPSYSVAWRNLGIALFNVRDDVAGAQAAFEQAAHANPADARVLYEQDQLWKKAGELPSLRMTELERRLNLVAQRDDLTVELATLYNQSGQPDRAAHLLTERRFQPWEGGEGLALAQYIRMRVALGRRALADGDAAGAMECFLQALNPPENLGEAWHLLANRSQVYYWLGVACDAANSSPEARDWFTRAADSAGDFQEMSARPYSEMTYYSVLALKQLGRAAEAENLARELWRYARLLRGTEPRIDYFATSLPAMLLFKDDLGKRNQITSLFLEAQATSALGYVRRSRRLLREVLRLDPNHNFASDLKQEIGKRHFDDRSAVIG